MTGTHEGPTNRTSVRRQIAADPTSTALLLSAPTAIDLWPGARRVAQVEGRVVVEASLPGESSAPERAAACVRALPPKRTPTSYVTCFDWSGSGLPATRGELTLAYSATPDGEVATEAVLVLESRGFEPSGLTAGQLEVMARGFLSNLASAAELRSRAA